MAVPVVVVEDLPVDPLAHAAAWRVLRLVCEVIDGRRPPSHLDAVAQAGAARYVRVLSEWLRERGYRGATRVVSMRVCQPHENAAEVAAVCRLAGRPRAVAARFERSPGPGAVLVWRCRLIRLG